VVRSGWISSPVRYEWVVWNDLFRPGATILGTGLAGIPPSSHRENTGLARSVFEERASEASELIRVYAQRQVDGRIYDEAE